MRNAKQDLAVLQSVERSIASQIDELAKLDTLWMNEFHEVSKAAGVIHGVMLNLRRRLHQQLENAKARGLQRRYPNHEN